MSAVKSQCFFNRVSAHQGICFTCRWLLRGGHSSGHAPPAHSFSKVSTAPSASTGYRRGKARADQPQDPQACGGHRGLCSPGFSTNSTHIISAFTPPSDRHTPSTPIIGHPLEMHSTAQQARWPVAASNCPAAPFSNAIDSSPPSALRAILHPRSYLDDKALESLAELSRPQRVSSGGRCLSVVEQIQP